MRSLTLRKQLFLGLVALGIAATLATSAVQIYFDYRQQVKGIERSLDAVETVILPALSSALWALDQQQVALLVHGLEALTAFDDVRVWSEGKLYAAEGRIPDNTPVITRRYPIIYDSGPETYELGEILIQSSLEPVYDAIYQRAGVTVLSNGLRTLIIAALVALLFERLFTRHFKKAVAYLNQPTAITESPPLKLDTAGTPENELTMLRDAINRLREKLRQFDAQKHQESARYYALVENNPEPIWRCEIAQPVELRWPAQEQAKTLIHHAVVAEANEPSRAASAQCGPELILSESWRQLPFINEQVLKDFVAQNYRLTDTITSYRDRDGNTHYFRNSLTSLLEDGKLTTIWGIATEITPRIEAQQHLEQREAELRMSQARLAEAQSLGHMGHWSYQAEDDLLQVSEEFCRIYGYPSDYHPSWRELIQRIHPDDRSHVIDQLASTRQDTVGTEHRIVWPHGEQRYVQAIARKEIRNEQVTSTFGIIMDISDRKRAEAAREASQRALVESEARMAEAQNIAGMGHWELDYHTKLFTCSDEFFRLYGHEPRAFEPSIKAFMSQVHPDDFPALSQALNEAKYRAFSRNYRIIRPDGQMRYLRGTVKPFYSGGRNVERVFGISLDVTEQKLAEFELQASQELFTKAFDSSPDGILFLDAKDFHILKCNRALLNLTGYEEAALMEPEGEIAVWGSAEQKAHVTAMISAEAAADNVEIELGTRGRDDLKVLLSWRPITLKGQKCWLVIARDVTDLRLLQETTEAQQKQLLQADKLASLGTMVAGVAHEINNPNHLIQMNADILSGFCHQLLALLEDYVDRHQSTVSFNGVPLAEVHESLPELLRDIQSSSKRIDRIVKDLKDFARPRESSEYLPVDFNDVVEKTLNLLGAMIDKNAIKLRLQLASELPQINADSQQLEQVLVNLIMNALDATNAANANANANANEILLSTRWDPAAKEIRCEVVDWGSGISRENLNRIFDPFFTTKQEGGGTGLGLAISYRLIQEHGGYLEAQSEPNNGTTMIIHLPT